MENKNRKTHAAYFGSCLRCLVHSFRKHLSMVEHSTVGVKETLSAAFHFYASLFYLCFYPLLIVYVVLWLNLGVYSWLVIAGFLAPPTIVWAWVVKKRLKNYIKLLMSNYTPVDTRKAVEEYLKLLEKSGEPHSSR